MSRSVTGGCRCGAVRYDLTPDRLPPVYCCHCRDCQTWSGSAFVEQAVVPANALSITKGAPTEQAFTTPIGVISRQFGCPACFSRLYTASPSRPGMLTLRAGTLDASDAVMPIAHIWTKRMQRWITLPDGVPAFAENAPADAFAAILSRAVRGEAT
ncbi:hypothetical protein DFR49_1437 [Hephaestia caeni]|uniref:CENP-V/GFA domain-containing protein n=1 Tax=Hephaestia caeni TaxID=645617 RepID=A0A397PI95_9SPHN|nr:GFA family protein [Hephaestia caeni]RIA46877.1 hypothetical protein DFR49_1437 [Hephaestia caeni]